MKDKWINTGYEGDDLKPHIEPVEDYSDPARIGESPDILSLQLQLSSCQTVLVICLFVCVTQRWWSGWVSLQRKSRTHCSIKSIMRSPPPTCCSAAKATWVLDFLMKELLHSYLSKICWSPQPTPLPFSNTRSKYKSDPLMQTLSKDPRWA